MTSDDAVPVPTPAVGSPDSPPLAVPDLPDPTTSAVTAASVVASESSALPPPEDGEGSEPGIPEVTNAEFVAAIFRDVPDGAQVAVCSKPGDPSQGGWHAQSANDVDRQCPPGKNNYVSCSTFYPTTDQGLKARKEYFAAYHALMLDDIGTKVPEESLGELEPTWRIETSPGNYQVGIALNEPLTYATEASELQKAIIEAGLCDPGAGGLNRWARLPIGINGKCNHVDANGKQFRCRLVSFSPDKRYTFDQVIALLKVTLGSGKKGNKAYQAIRSVLDPETVLLPKAPENPVIEALKGAGLYKTPLGSGKHDITCPWAHEHTDGVDSGTAYFEPDDSFPKGGLVCHHSHRDRYHIQDARSVADRVSLRRSDRQGRRAVSHLHGCGSGVASFGTSISCSGAGIR